MLAPLALPGGICTVGFVLSIEEFRGGGGVRTGRLDSGVTTGTGGGAEETFNMDFKNEDEEGDVAVVLALI